MEYFWVLWLILGVNRRDTQGWVDGLGVIVDNLEGLASARGSLSRVRAGQKNIDGKTNGKRRTYEKTFAPL